MRTRSYDFMPFVMAVAVDSTPVLGKCLHPFCERLSSSTRSAPAFPITALHAKA